MRPFFSLRSWLPAPQGQEAPLAFVHLYKTAGTSINLFLTNRFPSGQCCRLYPEHDRNYRDFLPPRPVACYSGHLRYDEMVSAAPSGATLFTILRDPIDRAVSAYHGCRRQPRAVLARRGPEYLPALELSLPELIRTHRLLCVRLFGDFQTNYLSRPREVGLVEDGSFVPPRRRDLDRARDNLSRCLTGTTERLDDTVTLLCLERGWPLPDRLPRANQNPLRPRDHCLDRETLAFLEEHTALDAELHRFAGELLQERWEKAHAGMARPPREFSVSFDGAIPGHGWYPREQSGGVCYCFSEPRAWLECRAPAGRDLLVEIDTLPLLPAEHAGPFTLRVNGREVSLSETAMRDRVTYRGVLSGGAGAEEARLDFEARPVRPCDVLPGSSDSRALGPAVTAVRLRAA